jgi:4-amino-4-deoxy-L-arabinose transferase-like glycosyltransferase
VRAFAVYNAGVDRNRVSLAIVAFAIMAGIALRTLWLDSAPPGLHPDEACEGYDAYSILETGRDHRGHFMPLAMEGFHDYRMPLFQYSLVPLVAAFGLKVWVIRLGAALWGIIDLMAVTAIALVMLGPPGAAAAALLYALCPWPLEQSRVAEEIPIASATVSLALLGFFLWLRYRKDSALVASAIFFGLSFYTYTITRALTPLIVVVLAVIYRRELATARRKILLTAAAVLLIFVVPQVIMLLGSGSEATARFAQISLWSYQCDGCVAATIPQKLAAATASFASNFTPSFLFLDGDRGDHWTFMHPPGFGELFPEQLLLIAIALTPLLLRKAGVSREPAGKPRKKTAGDSNPPEAASPDRRRFLIFLIGWLLLAALPAAAILPLGAFQPEPGRDVPTAAILRDHAVPNVSLTPQLLLSHPDSRHAALQPAPWTLLSALGLVTLLEMAWAPMLIRTVAAGLLLVGVVFEGSRFAWSYFHDYPILAAPYFQYGMEDVIRAVQSAPPGRPIVITFQVNQPYIYVLFYEEYPPAKFQRMPRIQVKGVAGPVLRFDRYLFVPPGVAWQHLDHGTFVFASGEELPAPAAMQVRYPDGRLAYSIVTK